MTSQGVPSRKRPAPGTAPAIHAPMGSIPGYTDTANQLSDDQFLQWGQDPHVTAATTQNFPIDPNPYNALAYATNQDVAATSNQPPNQLTKRPMNQNQLINRNRSFEQSSVSSVPESSTGDGWGESVAELEQRALIAKRDAQAKRKQIPPFVQKLRSFLDAPQYAKSIRWSLDGNSFIVLDEDEFARTLIPELFKHNKYASFVRQLNMYGFHKKVGLSDNSMRASERKNKSPSEYANPYFKRDHPDLLWLIQKPKNASGQGGKGGGKGAKMKTEDGEDHDADDFAEDGGRDERPRPGGQLAITSGENILPKDQLAGVYHELQNIRQQQQIISSTILKLRREHEQLYAQAANFQEQHSRHENSINAILTFLATVYNRSLQGHDGPQNIANSFSGIISQDQGNVVDVDDYALSTLNNNLAGPPFKRQPLLLKAPPQAGASPNNRATTLSPATTTYDGVSSRKLSRQQAAPTGNIEEIYDGTSPQPPVPARSPQDQRKPSRDIMSMIQNSNAVNGIKTTFTDFPNIVSSLETSGGNSALTPKQRADMLRQIARDTNVSDPGSVASSNNALITPTPPPMPDNYSAQLASTRNEIDNLMKMQAEQDRSVQNLTNLLQPLSPNGHIPGIEDGNVPPPTLDLDQIFNSHDYFTDLGDMDKSNNFDIGDTTGTSTQNYKTSGADDRNAHDSSELFDFDNLGGGDADLFGDHSNSRTTSGPTGYFDNYEDYTKPGAYNNDDLLNTRGGGVVDNSNNNNGNKRNAAETGRIIETLTDSEDTSPANTADENYSSLNIPDQVNMQSPKRRKKA